MTTDALIKRIAARAGLSERQTRLCYRAILEEAKALLSDGDVVRLPGLGKLQVDWRWGKFRLRFLPFRSCQQFLDEHFVENRESLV